MATIDIRLAVLGGRQAQGEFRATSGEVDRLDGRLSRVSRSSVDAARGLAAISSRAIGSGLRTAASGAGLLAAGLTGVVAAGATMGVKTAANMEQANIAFTTMLGSGERAKTFLSDLNAFAAKTPFDFPGLQTAASSLISAGIDADKVIPIMTSLGNATSGMGTGAEGVQRATVALQQMSAAGRITGEDLNQLRDAGVPVFDLLAAATGKSVAEVANLAQAGKLGRTELDQLMGALESGKGLERFNGLMEKQSASLTGLASTLKDTVGMGLAAAMQPFIPLLKEGVTWANQLAIDSLPAMTAATTDAAGWIRRFLDGFSQTGPATDSVRALGDRARDVFNSLSGFITGTDWAGVWGTIASAVTAAKDALAGVDFASLGAGLTSFGQAAGDSSVWSDALRVGATLLGTALQFLSTHMDTIIRWMPAIVAGLLLWRTATIVNTIATAAGIPLRIAELGVTLASARANAALAFQLSLLTGVQRASLATRIVDFAMKVKDLAIITLLALRVAAYGIAIGVVTAVTKVAAAGQWLLNAAMTANPIGLVVAGIALLVGGLVWFFTKTEIGRKAWTFLTDKFKEGVAWIKNTAVPVIKAGLTDALVWFGNKVLAVRDKIGGFIDKLRDAWNWVKKLADQISNSALGQAISTVSDGISGAFGGGRAAGGPVSAGTTYLVGERGPELVRMGGSGQVLDHQSTLAALSPSAVALPPVSLAKDDYGLSDGGGVARQPIHTHVYLNGREIAQAVYGDAEDQMARS